MTVFGNLGIAKKRVFLCKLIRWQTAEQNYKSVSVHAKIVSIVIVIIIISPICTSLGNGAAGLTEFLVQIIDEKVGCW